MLCWHELLLPRRNDAPPPLHPNGNPRAAACCGWGTTFRGSPASSDQTTLLEDRCSLRAMKAAYADRLIDRCGGERASKHRAANRLCRCSHCQHRDAEPMRATEQFIYHICVAAIVSVYVAPHAYVPILPTRAKHSRPSARAENAGLTFHSSHAPVLALYS